MARTFAMANQVGVVNTGHIQLRVSFHRRPEEIGLIGLSVAFGEYHPNAMFHFKLYPPETHILAGRLSDIASQLSNSPFLPVLIERPGMQVRASILDHHRIGLSVQVPKYDGVGAEVHFTLTPPEVNKLADLFLTALVSGGHMSPEAARSVRD
jgi:hypothetical protein